MFESSLLPATEGREARGLRVTVAGSMLLQAAVAGAFTLGPLLSPDALSGRVQPPRWTHVAVVQPRPLPVVPPKTSVARPLSAQALSLPPRSLPQVLDVHRSGIVSRQPLAAVDQEPLLAVGGGNVMGRSISDAVGIGAKSGSAASPVVVAAPTRPTAATSTLRVSSGVLRGLLQRPIVPVYPAIARAAHVEGTVNVTAVIDRAGRIVNARVTDGPLMLRDAALHAVEGARYQPYLLNGEPTEVVTTISVTFRMAG